MLIKVGKIIEDSRLDIDKRKVDFKNQDENIAVISFKEVSYKKTEQYNIKITNKTDKYIIIADSTAGAEIIKYLEERRKTFNKYRSQESFYIQEKQQQEPLIIL